MKRVIFAVLLIVAGGLQPQDSTALSFDGTSSYATMGAATSSLDPAGASIELVAAATDPNGAIGRVELFEEVASSVRTRLRLTNSLGRRFRSGATP